MTLNAKAHLEFFRRDHTIHLRDVAVTFAAVKTGLNMHLMAEIDKIGQIGDAQPFHRLTLVVVFAKISDLWVMDDYFAVAEHARFKGRYSGMVGVDSSGMTHNTTDFLVGYMNAMTKWNRLLHRGIYSSYGIEDKKRSDGSDKQYHHQYRKASGDDAVFFLGRRQ